VRAVLLAAALALACDAWSQAAAPDADHRADIARFRSRLAADVQRFRGQYPPAARQQGLEGMAVILVAVDADGRRTCTLKKSTGHEILDEKALAVVRYAASNVPMPEGLRGVAFSTEIRLQFALKPPAKLQKAVYVR
jgi:periplasmic protein TonB